jgi:hypothetical protein
MPERESRTNSGSPEREGIDRLTDRVWLIAFGFVHWRSCLGRKEQEGLDAGLEILSEEFARVKAAGERLEDLRAYLAEHGFRVSELPIPAEYTRISAQILDYLGRSDESRTRVEIEAHVEGRTARKRTALKNLCTTGKVVLSGRGSKGNPLRYGTRIAK